MIHILHKGTNNRLIVMLHGTGGNERDLIPIANHLDPDASYLGIRGNIEEQGMLRYFERYRDGTFNTRSLMKETANLYDTMTSLIRENGMEDYEIIVIGFSNGANIGINIFKEYNTGFKAIIALHPSAVRPEVPVLEQDLKVFMSYGDNDPFVTKEAYDDLKVSFEKAVTATESYEHNLGHQLTQDELAAAVKFYSTL